MGVNFSLGRDVFYAVNGLNERWTFYGREDYDLELRLRRSKIEFYPLLNRGIVYHVHHTERVRSAEALALVAEMEQSPEVRCTHGIEAVESFGVPCRRVEGRTGVYVDRARSARGAGPERKIASIGIGVRKWVTFHGFALNVSIDLAGFDAIVPCGLHDVEMTSLARELEFEGAGLAQERESAALELDGQARAAVGSALVHWLGPAAPPPR